MNSFGGISKNRALMSIYTDRLHLPIRLMPIRLSFSNGCCWRIALRRLKGWFYRYPCSISVTKGKRSTEPRNMSPTIKLSWWVLGGNNGCVAKTLKWYMNWSRSDCFKHSLQRFCWWMLLEIHCLLDWFPSPIIFIGLMPRRVLLIHTVVDARSQPAKFLPSTRASLQPWSSRPIATQHCCWHSFSRQKLWCGWASNWVADSAQGKTAVTPQSVTVITLVTRPRFVQSSSPNEACYHHTSYVRSTCTRNRTAP